MADVSRRNWMATTLIAGAALAGGAELNIASAADEVPHLAMTPARKKTIFGIGWLLGDWLLRIVNRWQLLWPLKARKAVVGHGPIMMPIGAAPGPRWSSLWMQHFVMNRSLL